MEWCGLGCGAGGLGYVEGYVCSGNRLWCFGNGVDHVISAVSCGLGYVR